MKPLLLGSTALICLGVTSSSVFAACSNTAPVNGETVTCTGTSTTPVVGGVNQTGITVNIVNGAQLNAGNNKAVRLQGGGQVNLVGNGSISTTGAGGFNHAASILDASVAGGSSVTLNDNSSITTSGPNGDGARIAGDNATITLNSNSSITLGGNHAIGAQGYGNHDSINLTGNSSITNSVTPTGLIGADITGNDGSVGLIGNSSINLTGPTAWGVHLSGNNDSLSMGGNTGVVVHGNAAYGVYAFGNGTAITLNGNAGLRAYGVGANAVDVIGSNTTLSLAGNSGISTSGNNAFGVKMTGGNANSVVMSDRTTLNTASSGAVGISLTGNNDSATLNGQAGIGTQGANAHGIYIHGNNGTISLNGGSIETYGASGIGAYIKGNFGKVSLSGGAFIETSNTDAYGILVAGNYGQVTLNGAAQINTSGNNGQGVLASQITLNDGAHITTQNGHGAVGQAITLNGSSVINAHGNARFGAYATLGGTITLNDESAINTYGNSGLGAYAKGAHSHVTLTGAATIETRGTNATGIQADNNYATINLTGSSSVTTLGSGASGISISAFGGVTNGSIALNDSSSVTTSGANALGISVTGDSNTVTLGIGAAVHTTGNGANAIFFTGGSNSLTNFGTLSATSAITVLGSTGAGDIDTIGNYGVIIGGSGTAIDLGAGNDLLTLGTGSHITGIINGGAGTDAVTLVGQGSDANVFQGWETLAMNGSDWSLSGTSTFSTSITVQQGRLAINGAISSPATTVQTAGILGGTGTLTSNVTSTGTIAPGNSPGTLTIVGTFAQTGGAFDAEFDKNTLDRLNVTGAVTLAGSPTLNLIPLAGAGGAQGIILHSNTNITGSFGSVKYLGNGAAHVTQTANDISLIAVDGTPIVAGDFAASQTGLDYLDDVSAEQIAGSTSCEDDACDRATKHLWARGFGRFAEESAQDGNQSFDYRIGGTAVGGDIEVAKGLKIGASLGYSNTEEDVSQHAASADINSGLAALYANYQLGRFFVTGALSGGWQGFDLARQVGGNEADATTTGWLVGTSLQAGMKFSFPDGWLLTPSAGIAWQHQWVQGYSEHGAGAGDVSIGSHQADAMRMKAQLELSQTYHPSEWIAVSPHLKVGIAEQKNFGGTANGLFSDGTNFDLALTDNSRTFGLAGVGFDVAFANGLTTYVDYDGQLASGRTVNAVIGGLRYSW